MSLATETQGQLDHLLDDLGQAMTLQRITAGAYDPTTGTTSSDTTTNYAGKGRLGDYDDRVIDGTLIKAGNRRCTFLPDDKSIVPQVGDKIVVGATTYQVMQPIKSRDINGIYIAHTFQVSS
jgi:hypothetical protein